MPEKEKLFAQFPPVSSEEWLNKVKVDLKGADFEKKLVWRTIEGFNVMPYYRSEDIKDIPDRDTPPGEFPYRRGTKAGNNEWYIRQDILVDDVKASNKKALLILNKGISSLGFVFKPETEFTPEMIADLLNGIFIESIEVNFCPQGAAKELLTAFKAYIKTRGIRTEAVKGAIETDPLGRYMLNGKLCIPIEDGIEYLNGLVEEAGDLENFRVISIKGSSFVNAGSTSVQELSFSLAMGNEYLSKLTDSGISVNNAARAIGFSFGTGSNYFMEIAKLRAARLLWARIVDAYKPAGKEACIMYIHSVTSEFNKTVYDPYVNMLRTQTEAMSATLGGTDSLTVIPFDSAYAEAGDFSERIARNQQLLLMEESHFGKIKDPAAGSYYLEILTASLAENAWNLFADVEEKGGFLACLKEGFIQEQVKETASKRKKNIAIRKEKLLGTNIYPNTDEIIKDVVTQTEGAGDISDHEVEPLKQFRAAEEFEKLRSAIDNSEKRPKVFLLTIGNQVMRKARAQFTAGFFGCAGYELIDNIGFETAVEGAEAALKAGADIVVVCSSDDEYAQFVPEISAMLDSKAITVVAGEPACRPDLEDAGVRHFISLRSNISDTLIEFNSLLGINK